MDNVQFWETSECVQCIAVGVLEMNREDHAAVMRNVMEENPDTQPRLIQHLRAHNPEAYDNLVARMARGAYRKARADANAVLLDNHECGRVGRLAHMDETVTRLIGIADRTLCVQEQMLHAPSDPHLPR